MATGDMGATVCLAVESVHEAPPLGSVSGFGDLFSLRSFGLADNTGSLWVSARESKAKLVGSNSTEINASC